MSSEQQRGRPQKYPLYKLQVGQYFRVPVTDADKARVRHTLANSMYYWKKKLGGEFSLRSVDGFIYVYRLS